MWFVILYIIGWVPAYYTLSRLASGFMGKENWDNGDRIMCSMFSCGSWVTAAVCSVLLLIKWLVSGEVKYNFLQKYVVPLLQKLEPKDIGKTNE